jgi:hypothetical protein
MAKNVSITVMDDGGAPCSNFYQVKFHKGSDPDTTLTFPSPLPKKTIDGVPNSPYIYLSNLADGFTFSYSVQRVCCNTIASALFTGTFNT